MAKFEPLENEEERRAWIKRQKAKGAVRFVSSLVIGMPGSSFRQPVRAAPGGIGETHRCQRDAKRDRRHWARGASSPQWPDAHRMLVRLPPVKFPRMQVAQRSSPRRRLAARAATSSGGAAIATNRFDNSESSRSTVLSCGSETP